jgi:hypothetical protein
MLIKVILLFLLVMAAIGLIGNALFPGRLGRMARRKLTAQGSARCKRCGKPQIGTSACDCRKT